ncbi:two-component sensor histidine kinase [Haloplanus aerogenes]|nr:two-component sensor histidine kinase [Haloplanus aerogenes]
MVSLPRWLKRWSLAITAITLAVAPAARLLVATTPTTLVLGGLVPLLLLTGVTYAGWAYARRESPAFTAIVTAWTLSVVAGMVVVAVWVVTLARLASTGLSFAMLSPVVTSAGAVTGLWLGTSNARWRERDATLRREREQLDFLNELLRHYVLNAAQVIVGRADRLAERTGDDDAVEISRSGRRIARHVQQMRALVTSDDSCWPVDLTAAVERARTSVDEQEVQLVVDLPETCPVVADDALDVLVEALLFRAVDRTEGDSVTVRLDAVEEDDGVRLVVVDDAGSPRVESVDPESIDTDHGVFEFQWYLVMTLTERYGGQVTVTDRDDGARVEVWLRTPDGR